MLEFIMDWPIAGLAALSYLAGGIPTGYLVVKRLRGIDIREHGSGNPGTANVYRVAGAFPGAVTLTVDALKGYLPVLIAQRLYPERFWIPILCGALAIIGHDWTVFLGFRGGKGVATSAGVFLAMMPLPMACTIAVFIAGVWATGHISIGSMAGAAALPIFSAVFKEPLQLTLLTAVSGALILYKHIPNIRRLREKKELQIHGEK